MKKLMIAAAIVCAAVLSQAATFQWKSGTSVQGADPTKNGAFNGTALANGAYTMYVWDNLTAKEYNDLDITSDSFYSTWIAKKDTAIGGGVPGAKTLGTTAKHDGVGNGETYYAAVLFTYTDGDGKDWYIANKATGTTDSAGAGKTISNLAKNIGGDAGTAITGWTAVAPEPTSGLLLLLGVAGLALRRRRA